MNYNTPEFKFLGTMGMLQFLFHHFWASESGMSVYVCCIMAFFAALAIMLMFGNKVIELLHAHQSIGQPIREDGPKTHLAKKGTPTMGGVLILGAAIAAILISGNLANPLVWAALLVLVVFGFVGFADDYVKVTKKTSNAMSAKMKLFLQFSTALIAVGVVSYLTPENERFMLNFPYFENWRLDLGWLYVPFAMVVIVGSSNAVNLTDGLDGLAAGLTVIAFAVFMLFAYQGEIFALNADVAVVCAAVVGACLGFLWFNGAPAKVFMGDTGSLALGGLLGTVAVMIKCEILLAIVGFIFVAEALSVMIQVFWYKRTGRRFFKMAPIHHHFEQCGWPETRVVVRFWVVGVILGVIGLLAL